MVAIISDDVEYRKSLSRYLVLRTNYPAKKVAEFGLSTVRLADLTPYKHLIIDASRFQGDAVDHFGITLCVVIASLFGHKTVHLACVDDPRDFFIADANIGTKSSIRYFKMPFDAPIWIKRFRSNGPNKYAVGALPELPSIFKVSQIPVSLTHQIPFFSHLNSVSLLVGAALCGEITRPSAAETMIATVKQYSKTLGDFAQQEKTQVHERIVGLKEATDLPLDLTLRDYVHDKTILLIDDQHHFGWGDALATIFFPKGYRPVMLGNGLSEYEEEGGQGMLVCASTQEQGLQFLETHKHEVKLVILDLYFGGKEPSGFLMLERIRKTQEHVGELNRIPVLIFSASYGATTIIQAFQEKMADGYFCKSVDDVARHKQMPYAETIKQYFKLFRKAVIHCFHKRVVRFRSKSEYQSYNDVEEWIAQFSPKGKRFAVRLLEHLDFRDTEAIRLLCRKAHQDLVAKITEHAASKAFYVAVGHPAKSGSHVLYYYRQENLTDSKVKRREKGETAFLSVHDLPHAGYLASFDKPKNFYRQHKIILVDDIIGSGKQFKEEFQQLLEFLPFLQEPAFHETVYYVALLALPDGINKIIGKYRQMDGRICIGEELSDRHQAFSDSVFPIKGESRKAKRLIKQISMNNKLYFDKQGKPRPFGHHDDALLIAFEHNTPNNTLPIFWAKRKKWTPLFERKE